MKTYYIILTTLICLIITVNIAAQEAVDPEIIKMNDIRSISKSITDLTNLQNLKPALKSRTIYNKQGLQSELIKYSNDEQVEIKYVYEYDDNGNITEVTGLMPDGTIGNKWTYEYNKEDNLIRQTSYRPDGQVGREYIFSYNESGLRQSEFIYNDKELIEKIEYVYEHYNDAKQIK